MGLTANGTKYAAYVLCSNGSGGKLALGSSASSPLTPGSKNYRHVPIKWGTVPAGASDARSSAYMMFNTSTGKLTNSNTFYFNDADGGSWGTITHILILDSTNTILYSGELTASVEVTENKRPKFAAGAIQLTFS